MQRRYRGAQDVHAHFCLRVDFRDGVIEEGGFAVERFVDAVEAEDGDWDQAVLNMCKQPAPKGEEALTFRREGGSVAAYIRRIEKVKMILSFREVGIWRVWIIRAGMIERQMSRRLLMTA